MTGVAESAYDGLEIAFGVDQEIGRNHDLFAFLDPAHYFHVGVGAASELHLAWLEAPFGELDQNDLARAAVDDGGIRHGQHLSLAADR